VNVIPRAAGLQGRNSPCTNFSSGSVELRSVVSIIRALTLFLVSEYGSVTVLGHSPLIMHLLEKVPTAIYGGFAAYNNNNMYRCMGASPQALLVASLWAEEGYFSGPFTEPGGSFCLTGCPQCDTLTNTEVGA
jgi:hypothetical protein